MPLPATSAGPSVALGGEYGRRVSIPIENNLLQLDIEKDFLAPLREKTGTFTGVGALLNAASLLAAQTSDPRVVAIRDQLAESILSLQEADGYIGSKAGDKRLWEPFDVDEGCQILAGLVTHHRFTGSSDTLDAAQRLSRFVAGKFRAEPGEVAKQRMLCDTLLFLGLELGQLDLHAVTGDDSSLNFVREDRKLGQ